MCEVQQLYSYYKYNMTAILVHVDDYNSALVAASCKACVLDLILVSLESLNNVTSTAAQYTCEF